MSAASAPSHGPNRMAIGSVKTRPSSKERPPAVRQRIDGEPGDAAEDGEADALNEGSIHESCECRSQSRPARARANCILAAYAGPHRRRRSRDRRDSGPHAAAVELPDDARWRRRQAWDRLQCRDRADAGDPRLDDAGDGRSGRLPSRTTGDCRSRTCTCCSSPRAKAAATSSPAWTPAPTTTSSSRSIPKSCARASRSASACSGCSRSSPSVSRNCRRHCRTSSSCDGLLPICSYCKRIRGDDQYWQQVEGYIAEHSDAQFSHGICPTCYVAVSAELDEMIRRQRSPNPR